MIDYDGRRFRDTGHGPDGPSARYRQSGDLLWAEFDGGSVRRGALTGRRLPDDTIEFTYTMVLTDGEILCGRCHSVPETLPDGRIRLNESWERYGPHAGSGTSVLEEI